MFSCIFQKRNVLEEGNQLELRVSALDEDLEDMETSDEEEVVVRYHIHLLHELDYDLN